VRVNNKYENNIRGDLTDICTTLYGLYDIETRSKWITHLYNV